MKLIEKIIKARTGTKNGELVSQIVKLILSDKELAKLFREALNNVQNGEIGNFKIKKRNQSISPFKEAREQALKYIEKTKKINVSVK